MRRERNEERHRRNRPKDKDRGSIRDKDRDTQKSRDRDRGREASRNDDRYTSHRMTDTRPSAKRKEPEKSSQRLAKLPKTSHSKKNPDEHVAPSLPPKQVPTSLLSFGEEVEESETAAVDFSISKSTAKRFAKERTLVLRTSLSSEANQTEGLRMEDADALTPGDKPIALEAKTISRVYFGSTQAIGARPYMEDRYTVIPDFQPLMPSGGRVSDGVGRSFAGVYDGHNGSAAAEAAAAQLHLLLARDPLVGVHTGDGPPATLRREEEDISKSLKSVFRTLDDHLLARAREEKVHSGSTAVVVYRNQDVLYTANAGDSRAVMCSGGKAIRLTQDHKPDLPAESARIKKNGGQVEFQACWRVVLQGSGVRPKVGLAVSRCLGDQVFKEPNRLVECEPDVTRHRLTPDDKFILLASDGLWDVLTDQEAVDVVDSELMKTCLDSSRQWSESHITQAAQAVVEVSLRKGAMDNITCVVMLFAWG